MVLRHLSLRNTRHPKPEHEMGRMAAPLGRNDLRRLTLEARILTNVSDRAQKLLSFL